MLLKNVLFGKSFGVQPLDVASDTYVFGGQTTTNFVTNSELRTRDSSGTTNDYISFLRFSATNLNQYKKLVITPKIIYENGTLRLSVVNVAVDLSTVTFATKPTNFTEILQKSVATTDTITEFNIESFMQNYVGTDIIFALESITSNRYYAHSKEGATRPKLTI